MGGAVMDEAMQSEVLIIGTGFSGLGMAIYLQRAGITDYILLEKAAEVGGTWRDNHYPGAECDVPSALYSYSFEHNPEWQYKWAEQGQIFEYLKHNAGKYQLYQRIHFNREVAEASFVEDESSWLLKTTDGHRYRCRFLISAVGQLHRPFIPAYTGQDGFGGMQFHSACWKDDVALSGKRVAVIGNAASALQFIPHVAAQAKKLTVFQRSANWVWPKLDRPYWRWEQWLSDKLPVLTRLYRLRLWLRNELLVYRLMKGNRLFRKIGEMQHRRYLHSKIADPELRAKLTPDYPIGAKRILVSDDYYDALARDNVDVVTAPIDHFDERSIVCSDGRSESFDVVIYGTGFRTNPFLAPMRISGRDGRRLAEVWRDGAQAYLGMTVSGFPNLFMLYGPNTNLGHNSIVIMAEAQARFIVDCISRLKSQGQARIEVRADAQQQYNRELQQRLRQMVWNRAAASWYKDAGKITNNWAGTTWEYLMRTRKVQWKDFEIS